MKIAQIGLNLQAFLRENKKILLILFLYSVILFIGILHHEMWRDELQAWMIATSSSSIADLFINIKYETHPFLWYFPLWFISKITVNPFGIQLFHFFLAVANAFLILKFSPFKLYQKIMLIFGYSFLFEFAMISRNYALGILFCLLFMAIYSKYGVKKPFFSLLFLGLAALSNLCSFIFALSLCGFYLMDLLKNKLLNKKVMLYLLGFILACVLSASQIALTNDGSFGAKPLLEFDSTRFDWMIGSIFTSCFYFPAFVLNFWNTDLLQILLPRIFLFCSSAFFISFLIILLRKNTKVLLFFVSSLILLSGFIYTTNSFNSRILAHIFLIVLFSFWFILKDNSLDNWKKNSVNILLSIMLFFQLISGIFAYIQDFKSPFSSAKETAEYINSNRNLKELPIIGFRDYAASPISGFLNKNVYYLEQNDFGTYVKWTKQRAENSDQISNLSFLNAIRYLSTQSKGGVLLITNGAFSGMTPVFVSKDSIVLDEKFYIYYLN